MAVLPGAGAEPRNVGAILRVLTAMAMFAAGDATLKQLVATYAVGQVLFLSGLISLAVLVPIMWRAGEFAHVRTRRPIGNLLRIAAGLAGQILLALALKRLPLADTTAIMFSVPLFVTAFSVPLLGEHVGWRRWGAVIVGFGGVLIITRPGVGALEPAMVLAVGASLGFALMITATRWLSRTERSLPLLLYMITGYTAYGAVLTPFQWVSPPAADFGLFAALGLFYTLGYFMEVRALSLAPVAVITPFMYTALLWAVLFGWLAWGEWPAANVWAGAAVMTASGLYILFREIKAHSATVSGPTRL